MCFEKSRLDFLENFSGESFSKLFFIKNVLDKSKIQNFYEDKSIIVDRGRNKLS